MIIEQMQKRLCIINFMIAYGDKIFNHDQVLLLPNHEGFIVDAACDIKGYRLKTPHAVLS